MQRERLSVSLINHEAKAMSRAEAKFRDAFDRLKAGKVEIVPVGTKVSQNAVAKRRVSFPPRCVLPDFQTCVARSPSGSMSTKMTQLRSLDDKKS